MITTKGATSGEFGFENTIYIDAPDNIIAYGFIRYFKHNNNYVTVILYPENTQNVFYRRFVLGSTSWYNNWWKTSLTEIK